MNEIFLYKLKSINSINSLRNEVYLWARSAAQTSQFCLSEEEATQFAEARVLLPFECEASKQHCFEIRLLQSTIGRAWLSEKIHSAEGENSPKSGTRENIVNKLEMRLAYITIDEPFQRKGFGAKALPLLEQYAKEKGIRRMTLNVFGHLPHAENLYRKMGYHVIEQFHQNHILLRTEMMKLL